MADRSRIRYLRSHNPALYLVSHSHIPCPLERLLEVAVYQMRWFTQTDCKDFLGPNPHMWRPCLAQPYPAPVTRGGHRPCYFDSYCPNVHRGNRILHWGRRLTSPTRVDVLVVFMSVHRIDVVANYAASHILLETDPVDRSIFLV